MAQKVKTYINIVATVIFTSLILFLASCKTTKTTTNTSVSAKMETLQDKYAPLLGVSKTAIQNEKLFSFIDEWYNTPYKYGGNDKSGIDCSGFTQKLQQEVYGKTVPRVSREIYSSCKDADVSDLKEGDFVFFKVENSNVNHVGVYITNNKFVHASTKKGVMINDLNETYYKKYFFKGGKLK